MNRTMCRKINRKLKYLFVISNELIAVSSLGSLGKVKLYKKIFFLTHAGENVGKLEPLWISGRNVKCYSHCEKQHGGSLKN